MTDTKNKQDSPDAESHQPMHNSLDQSNKKNAVYRVIAHLLNHSHPFPVFYSLSGIFLFGTLFILFNVYILNLKVESAVVSAPVETIVSPASGVIMDIFVTAGTYVKKNSPLIRIENIELVRDAALARLQFIDSTLTVRYLNQALENEQKKMSLYKMIGVSRLASSKAVVRLSQHELIASKKNLDRVLMLKTGHYITPTALDEAATKYSNAQEKLKSASAMETIAGHALNGVDLGFYYTGDKWEGMICDLKAQIDAARDRLVLSKQRAAIYARLLRRLTLLAPFNGNILQVMKTTGNTTDSTHPLILISKNDAKKSITAFLTQNEIKHVRSGSHVKIYIPSAGEFYHGTVTGVDRTSGFVDEMNAQFRWRDLQTDRSATVTVDINPKDHAQFEKKVTAGMPAILYFPRKFIFL